jgi:hypothetical protein
MAKLYSGEAEVKQAIKKVLKEEQDVIMQLKEEKKLYFNQTTWSHLE